MHKVSGLSLVFCLGICLTVPAVADEPDGTEIARLIKQLGSDVFKDREAATKRLKEMGEPALEDLLKAELTLEQKRRADRIIAAIEDKLYGPELCSKKEPEKK